MARHCRGPQGAPRLLGGDPPQADDFEYFLESGDTKFPVSAGSASPIYQTVVVAGKAE